jgi:hypothetical protein
MTQSQYVVRRELSILELGETLGNISDACRKLGVSRPPGAVEDLRRMRRNKII